MKKNIFIFFSASIFFFALASSAMAANVYYSVGQYGSSTNLVTGSTTLTINGGVGTFSVAQTGNIGVGDRVTYNTNSVAYISSKTSTTVWNLVTATGGVPADITTSPVVSITREYTSLSAAEAGATDANHLNTTDLVAGNFQLNFPCYYDTGEDMTAVSIDGYTTGENNYIKVYTPVSTSTEVNISQRHSGKWDDGKYQLIGTGSVNILRLYDDFVRVDGLQVAENNVTTDISSIWVQYVSSGSQIYISNSISRSFTGNGSYGLFVGDTDIVNLYLWNNIIYGGWDRGIYISGPTNSYVYNNTIKGCEQVGITGGTGTIYARNNAIVDTVSANDWHVVEGSPYSTNNISNGETPPGDNGVLGKPSFVDEANSDYNGLGNSDRHIRWIW